ncbi:MAG: hypothetical protein KY469_01585 [Actinobacteria bacterium]|nr:hypothetical protein [Actinomycetota bacterium]
MITARRYLVLAAAALVLAGAGCGAGPEPGEPGPIDTTGPANPFDPTEPVTTDTPEPETGEVEDPQPEDEIVGTETTG